MRAGRILRALILLAPLGPVIGPGPLAPVEATSHPHMMPATTASAAPRFASLPLSFEPNMGQVAPNVRYLAHGPSYTVLLTDQGAIMALSASRGPGRRTSLSGLDSVSALRTSTATVGLFPVNAAPHPQLVASGPQRGKVNYFIGRNPSRWHVDVPTFSHVVYRDVYPGIDLVFRGETGGRLEYDWAVRPHADAHVIRMRVEGARSMWLAPDGSVELKTASGIVWQRAPRMYQVEGAKRVAVSGAFRLLPGDALGLRLGPYDPRRDLVVDPQVTYSTYFGSASRVAAVAVGPSNRVYFAGDVAQGFTVPAKSPLQSEFGGGVFDAYVAEMSTDGTGLVYSTYLGGIGDEHATGLAVDDAGGAYVAGTTTAINFPGAHGMNGPFVVKLSPSGDKLIYSHIDNNGDGRATIRGIAVDSSGDAYYTGSISVTPRAPSQMYVRWLNPAGQPVGSPYLEVNGSFGQAIALDSRGNVYVAGSTTNPSFPSGAGTVGPTFGGDTDAFVMELDGGLSRDWATFLGGTGADQATGIAVDTSNNIYVTGITMSTNFPVTNPLQNRLKGSEDSFVTELSPFGRSYVYSTYLGGIETGAEQASGIVVDGTGSAFVTGFTTAADFPTVNSTSGAFHGGADVFVSQVAPDGAGLVYSTLIGGSQDDEALAIALGQDDDIFVGGFTNSANFPLAGTPVQSVLASTSDGFLLQISNRSSAAPPPPPPGGSTATDTPTATDTATPGVPAITTVTATLETLAPPPTETPTPTETPIPEATTEPTDTQVPAPDVPTIVLGSPKVNAGSKLKVTVSTAPQAAVSIKLQVKQHGSVVFVKTKRGTANEGGNLTRSFSITYHPTKQVKARVTVAVTTAGGTATNSATVTIVPHA